MTPTNLSLFDLPVTASSLTFNPDALTDYAELLDIHTLYVESGIESMYPRAAEILARFPNTERVEVPSHWNIPALNGDAGNVSDWLQIKRSTLVLGVKKGMQIAPNDRSADWIAPSHANGCASSCAYCYVSRRKGFANPITTFVNIDQIINTIRRHSLRQGAKTTPTLADPDHWVYEIGTNNDCSIDALIGDNVRDLVAMARRLPNAKLTFATKFVNRGLLDYDPQGHTRIRFSLMPQKIARVVDVRTSKIADRIGAINDFVAAGYGVNINFAPIIYYEGWQADYADLFDEVDAALSPAAKKQLQAEVIFLTHNAELHVLNLGWHPKAEDLLWTPDVQEGKISGFGGGHNIRYKLGFKGALVSEFSALLGAHLPYCTIRYRF